MRFKFTAIFIILLINLFSQETSSFSFEELIPKDYRTHPELGKTKLKNPRNTENFELIHLRTEFSRVFIDKNGIKTSVQSATPLHFKDNEDRWHSLNYNLMDNENKLFLNFPAERPKFKISKDHLSIKNVHSHIVFGREKMLLEMNKDFETINKLDLNTFELEVDKTHLLAKEAFPNTDIEISFFFELFKTNFKINSIEYFNKNAKWIAFGDKITIPENYSVFFEKQSTETINYSDLIIADHEGKELYRLPAPIITDSKKPSGAGREIFETREHNTLNGFYKLQKIDESNYNVLTMFEAEWLFNDERVLPILVDPIVAENNSVLNSCFFPDYGTGDLSANIPEGESIFSTYLEWDFTAVNGSNGWMSDQRSYASSVNGSTNVFQGSGNTAGVQNYSLLSPIANEVSTGSINVTFHAARTWGNGDCNNTFNFISRRYAEFSHGILEFGEGDVVINEYSCSNRQMLDEFGNYEDWVELYNNSSTFVDLTGYYLSDNPNNPTKWQFPGGLIAPNGHLIVYCSGRGYASGTSVHSNFRLTQLDPESILFSDPEGNLLESYELWTTQNAHSYGRVMDGAENWGVFETATPGASNVNVYEGYTSKPQFSLQAGHYQNAVTVEITSENPNEIIRYTTDGSEPVASSPIYTNPITVSNTTVVKARSFSNNSNILPGFYETNTYLINENHTLPVFSFSGAQLPTLFGGSQIEPIAAYEFFDENGVFIDEAVGDFDKHGNDSWSYAQRGVDFVARDEYGYNDELKYPFFGMTSNRTKFQRLMVKAAANDNYPFENGGAHIRDSYIQHLSQVSHLNLDERSSTNCIVYVNGEYWGVYDLREKVDDKDYTRYYYNQRRQYKGSEEYIQFLKTWGGTQSKYGEQRALNDWTDMRNYIQNNNMADPQHYEYVKNTLDISSLIDYFVINSFIVSRDWLNYNTGWWRGLNPDGDATKWRYILWDMEAALGHFINYTGMPNTSATGPPCQVENLTVNNNGHVQSLSKLINENEEVRHQYITRYADLNNTHFSCENLLHVLDSMVAAIEPEMPRQIERWGGSFNGWQANVQTLRNFLTDRCEFINTGLINCYNLTGPYDIHIKIIPENAGKVKMNSEWLHSYPFDANIFGNIDTYFKASGQGPYSFESWEMTNHDFSMYQDTAFAKIELTQNDTLTVYFADTTTNDRNLIYYWHFNDLDTESGDVTSIQADYSLLEDIQAFMFFDGSGNRDMDEYNNGSEFNLQLEQSAGKAVRVRNRSDNRSLIFNLPTIGLEDVVFEYSVYRSGSGMLQNIISYSVDGINFIQDSLLQTTFEISESYQHILVDFKDIASVSNNPNFHIKIEFDGNTAQNNGNNRFDNITLKANEGDFEPIEVPEIDDVLLYYWHFNNLDTEAGDVTSIIADYSLFEDVTPVMNYTGSGNRDIDVYENGSIFNLQLSELPGQAARVRNRSENRSLIFNLPTTGYQDIIFSYTVYRSENGMLYNSISYTMDGVNFVDDNLNTYQFEITEEYQTIIVDFSEIPWVNNNPNFHIKIEFEGNTNQDNGNNRFDNIALHGKTYEPEEQEIEPDPNSIYEVENLNIEIYPNPFDKSFIVKSNEVIRQISIYDLKGRLVKEEKNNAKELNIQADFLSQGVYLIIVKSDEGSKQFKLIKY